MATSTTAADSANTPLPSSQESTERSDVLSISNLKSLKEDFQIMFSFAVDKGYELPTNLTLDQAPDDSILLTDYNALRKVIAPVTPESIRYIQKEMLKGGAQTKWYRIPVFSKCIIIAFIALISLIAISCLNVVNGANQAKGLLDSSGTVLLANLTFICAASLLGVMFYLLKNYADKIKKYTFKPSDALELNSSIIIGVISGFVITELFSFTVTNLSNDYIEIQKMTLALLGGFSSDAIFSILQGVVNKFKAMFVT